MNRTPVTSKQLKSVGHDPINNKMHVEFTNGSLYEYDDVSTDHHSDLMSAPSVGQHFNLNVKYKYVYRKLDSTLPLTVQ